MSTKNITLLLIVTVAFLGGGMGAITKIGLAEIPPLSFAFIRFFLASLIILPFFLMHHEKRSKLRVVLPISLFATGNITLYTLGVQTTTATISQLLYSAVPLFVTLLLYILFREKLSKREMLGIGVGFLGMCLFILLPVVQRGTDFSGSLIGNVLILLAVASYSCYMVYSRKLLKTISPFFITSVFIFISTIILSPFFLYDIAVGNNWMSQLSFSGFGAILYVTLVGTLLLYVLSQYAIKHGGLVYASLTFYLQPLFGYLFGMFLLGEQLTFGIILGAAIMLTGLTLVIKSK
ncbi:MAG: DMT family transporter [Patescibacteria group bacterium]